MYLKLIEETPKEILSYYEKPFYVYLSLSNICNANCVFCDVRTNKEKNCNIDIELVETQDDGKIYKLLV